MQINHYPLIYKKWVQEGARYFIVLACVWFIYIQFSKTSFNIPVVDWSMFLPIFLIVLFLTPINWFLEALRWKIAVPFESISTLDAVKIILRGLALNVAVPFTIGDMSSRLVEVKNRPMSVMAMAFNRLSLLLVTVVFGGLSVIYYFGFTSVVVNVLFFFIILIGLLALLVFSKSVFQIPLSFITSRLAIHVFLLTLLRYGVFTFQFYLLISFFNPILDFAQIIMGIGWIFLFRSVIPSVLGGIGVREASSIIFFQSMVSDLDLIVFPCLIIWVVNTIIPSLVGLIPVINFRIKLAQ